MKFKELSDALAKITTDQPLLDLETGTNWKVTQRTYPNYLFRVSVTGGYSLLRDVKIIKVGGTRSIAKFTKNELADCFSRLKDEYQTTNYENVRWESRWRRKFAQEKIDFTFYDKATGATYIDKKRAIFCKGCGIYLPIKNISVDHQAPQSKGGNLAILRVFRHLGYTLAGPVGRKATPSSRAGGGSQADRYTLNMEGRLLYSCFSYGGYSSQLENTCMHSFYNLDPMCSSCNSSKSNVFKGHYKL